MSGGSVLDSTHRIDSCLNYETYCQCPYEVNTEHNSSGSFSAVHSKAAVAIVCHSTVQIQWTALPFPLERYKRYKKYRFLAQIGKAY